MQHLVSTEFMVMTAFRVDMWAMWVPHFPGAGTYPGSLSYGNPRWHPLSLLEEWTVEKRAGRVAGDAP